MLDDKDVKRLIDVFATREEIKEMISNLVTKEEFSSLQTAVDNVIMPRRLIHSFKKW